MASLYSVAGACYERSIVEDGLIENATAVVYLCCFVLGLSLAKRVAANGARRWSLFYVALSFAFLFVAMEEISWGQRLLAFESPSLFHEQNIQKEVSLHNLSGLYILLHPAYIMVGFVGAFGGRILEQIGVPHDHVVRLLPRPRLFVFFLSCSLFYLVAEIISPFTTVTYFGDLRSQFAAGQSLEQLEPPQGVLAIPAHMLDTLRDCLPFTGNGGQRFVFWRHQEPAEFMLSLGFLLFVVNCWKNEARFSVARASDRKSARHLSIGLRPAPNLRGELVRGREPVSH